MGPDPAVFSIEPIRLGPLIIGRAYLWSFVAAIILLVVFVSFFKYTRWGLAMQATADDEMAALSLGVSARFVYATAWAIAFMASGVGGTLLGNINGLNISVGHLGLLVDGPVGLQPFPCLCGTPFEAPTQEPIQHHTLGAADDE